MAESGDAELSYIQPVSCVGGLPEPDGVFPIRGGVQYQSEIVRCDDEIE